MCSHPRILGRSLGRLLHLAGEKIGLAKRELGHISHRLGQAHPRRKLFQSCQRVDELSATLHRLAKSGMEGGKQTSHCRKSWNYRAPIKSLANSEPTAWLVERVNAESAKRFNAHCADFENNLINCNYSHRTTCCREVTPQATSTPGKSFVMCQNLKWGKSCTRLTRGTVISTVRNSTIDQNCRCRDDIKFNLNRKA